GIILRGPPGRIYTEETGCFELQVVFGTVSCQPSTRPVRTTGTTGGGLQLPRSRTEQDVIHLLRFGSCLP
ncbi:unnamed protein product, partial [Amoebophrya sp. A120]